MLDLVAGVIRSSTRDLVSTQLSATSKSRCYFGEGRRIQKRTEFRLVYDTGVKMGKRSFMAFCLYRGDTQPTRAGFTTPRALGGAVKRNRLKRRMREAVRISLERLPVGWSLVFNPRQVVATMPFTELLAETEQVLERCANLS